MRQTTYKINRYSKLLYVMTVAIVALSLLLVGQNNIFAASLSDAEMTLNDPRDDADATSVEYDLEASNVTTASVKCLLFEFTTTATGSTVPTGIDTTSAALDTANTDYVPTPGSWTADGSTNGTVEITFATGETPASGTDRNVVVDSITNPTSTGTYFVQFSTYDNADCSTSPVDEVTVAFAITDGQSVSLTVDPTLSFSVAQVGSGVEIQNDGTGTETTTAASTSSTLPFGTVSDTTNGYVAQDLTVGTNAQGGYTVFARYTGQLTNAGGDTIDDAAGSFNTAATLVENNSTEEFGYTTDDTDVASGDFDGDKFAALTTTNQSVMTNASAQSASETERVGYGAGIASSTEAGEYSTTVIYTAVPTY